MTLYNVCCSEPGAWDLTKKADIRWSKPNIRLTVSLSIIIVHKKRVGVLFSFQLCAQISSLIDSSLSQTLSSTNKLSQTVCKWMTHCEAHKPLIHYCPRSHKYRYNLSHVPAPDVSDLICIHVPHCEAGRRASAPRCQSSDRCLH